MIKDGDKLLCVDASKQRIVKEGQTYTAYVRDGINAGEDRVYIKEHKRFALLLSRFKLITKEL